MYHSKISGLGYYVPDNIVTNNDLAQKMDTNDEWIQERTGIQERRHVIRGEDTTTSMGVKAAKIAIERSGVAKEEFGGPRRVALIGRPNVGKSSLLNKAVGSERAVVNDLAGTTRDPIDEQVDLGGKIWRFVDTAGIRRRLHLAQGADFYASLRTAAALERAEVLGWLATARW